jgi:hypothetical protein
MRMLVTALLAGVALLAGCAGLPSTPFDAQMSCQAVGGSYGADGVCHAGL